MNFVIKVHHKASPIALSTQHFPQDSTPAQREEKAKDMAYHAALRMGYKQEELVAKEYKVKSAAELEFVRNVEVK